MKSRPATRRAGLAPLELVLVLPILLFVMALMINFGTGGAWKIRTQVNARHAAWRALEFRSGQNDSHPNNWPDDATLNVNTASGSPVPFDPYAAHAVVRGPVLVDPVVGEYLPVRPNILDMRPELVDGRARISRPYPLLKSLPGDLTFSRDHVVFDGTRFQFPSMSLASNTTRRVLGLYPMMLESRASEESQEYLDAALAVFFDPNEPALLPLTGGDPEIIQLLGEQSPNFQPQLLSARDWRTTRIPQVRTRVPDYCESNPETVKSQKVDRLRRAIRNVPRQLSDYYSGVYNRVIGQLEMLDPKPPGADALIAELRGKLNQIRTFRASLPPRS